MREILDATAMFRPDEVSVALELFDEVRPSPALRHEPSGDEPARCSDYELLGAFDADGRLTGYACFGPTPATDRTFDLYWIAVHPSDQGRGIGSSLLNAVERDLADRDARLLVVETSSRSSYEPTREFYRARGYCEAARVRDFYAPADDRLVFTKRLDVRRGAFGSRGS